MDDLPEDAYTCGICGEHSVLKPWIDWCHVCHAKLCQDCIAARDDEHGCLWCEGCAEADRMLALIAEVDRLRAIEAAGERLARDVGRFVEEVEDTDDVPIRRQALRLGLALAAWEAARQGESIP